MFAAKLRIFVDFGKVVGNGGGAGVGWSEDFAAALLGETCEPQLRGDALSLLRQIRETKANSGAWLPRPGIKSPGYQKEAAC